MTKTAWLAVIILVYCGAAHAETHIFVPDIMIQGTPYEGMVLAEEPASGPRTILLASDGPLHMPYNVTIPAGSNHAIFPVHPHGAGVGRVSAVPPGGPATHAPYTIHADPAAYRLHLVMPGAQSLASPGMPVFIFLTDGAGLARQAPHAIPVHIDASPSIDIPDMATIEPGSTHTVVQAAVHHTGTIHASSPDIPGDHIQIHRDGGEVAVRIGVAPDPAPEGSTVAYFVWLERDGVVYEPPRDYPVYVVSDSPAASTGPVPEPFHRGVMKDGMYSGMIYTGQAAGPGDARLYGNEATITAIIPGVGSGSHTMRVGAQPDGALERVAGHLRDCIDGMVVIHIPCGPAMWVFASLGGAPSMLEYEGEMPNVMHAAYRMSSDGPRADAVRLWAFPDTPHHTVWVVAGFYGTGGVPDVWVPAPAPAVHDIITSHSSPYTRGTGPVLIPLETGAPLNLTVSAPGIPAAHIAIPGSPDYGRAISWEGVPHGGGMLGAIHVTDAEGRAVHPGRLQNLTIYPYGGASVSYMVPYGAAAAVYGHADGEGGLLARFPGAPPARIPLDEDAQNRTVSLWMPRMVHVSEEFPVALHVLRDGVPVSRVYDATYNSESLSPAPRHRMVADHAGGRLAAVWDGMAAWGSTTPFLNTPRVTMDTGEGQVRLGQNITIFMLDAPAGATIRLDGLQFHRTQDAYTARPERAGPYTVNVTVAAPGWHTHSRTIPYVVDRYEDVTYMARSDDSVPVPFALRLESGDTHHTILPGETMPVAPGAWTAVLDDTPNTGGNPYSLRGVAVNNSTSGYADRMAVTISEPTLISAEYARVVEVYTSYGGALSGMMDEGRYAFGDAVSLRAEPAPVVWWLVRAVPVHWEGLPPDATISDGMASFVALRSADILVTYDLDFTPLMVLAGAGSAAAVFVMRERLADIARQAWRWARP